jgi:hypothetical protein
MDSRAITSPRPRELTTRYPVMSAEHYWPAVEREYWAIYGGDVSWSDDIRPCWEAGYSVEMAARAIRERRQCNRN